jgi:hypothetical protein
MNPEGNAEEGTEDQGLMDEENASDDDDDEISRLRTAIGSCPPVSDLLRSKTESLE